MTGYFIRRFLLIIPTFIGITVLVFTILQFCPGNIVDQELERIQTGGTVGGEVAGGTGGLGVSRDLKKLRKYYERLYGYDRPIAVQYLDWLSRLVGIRVDKIHPGLLQPEDVPDPASLLTHIQTSPSPLVEHVRKQLLPATVGLIKQYERQNPASSNVAQVVRNDLNRLLMKDSFFQRQLVERMDIPLKIQEAMNQDPLEKDTILLNRLFLEFIFAHQITTSGSRPAHLSVTLAVPDMGTSYVKRQAVLEAIIDRLPVSITIGLIGFFLTYLICIPLGVMKAVLHKGQFDFISSVLIFVAYSIPGWALGVVLLRWLGGNLGLVPLGGLYAENFDQLGFWEKLVDLAHHAALPVFCYMLGNFATMTILMKNSLMENLSADYVRTAFAKGLSERRVIFLHALRNSMIPIATGLGHALSLIIAGSFLIEKVFNINGFGLLGFSAIQNRDYPLALGILVIASILKLVGNIFSDMLYCVFDPRIRFQ